MQEISRRSGQAVTFALAIAKVDAETRTVRGVASQEIVDAHGQIVDYATLKACLPAYKHNIREMHQPKAVGKALAIECDDATQAVIVEAFVSKGAEDTWQKCLDGTLAAYSIGGLGDVVVSKNADGKTESRIFMSALHEISLVDVGACPTATFAVVKMVDGVPTDVRPADPVAVRKHLFEGYDIERALMVLALLQEIVGSEIGDLVYGDETGDPEAAAQVDTLRLAFEIVFDFLLSEFTGQFDALDARMAAIGKLASPAGAALTASLAALVEKQKTGLARIDKALAQKLHDNARHFGAACETSMEKTITDPVVEVTEPVIEKAAEPVVVAADPVVEKTDAPLIEGQQVASMADLVKSAVADATAPFAQQIQEHQAKSAADAETIAKLEERLRIVEASPAGGGPVRTVPGPDGGVEKTLAGDTSTPTGDDAATLVKLAAELAPDMTDAQRADAVKKVLAATFAMGGTPIAR